jgi:hypothetical protein
VSDTKERVGNDLDLHSQLQIRLSMLQVASAATGVYLCTWGDSTAFCWSENLSDYPSCHSLRRLSDVHRNPLAGQAALNKQNPPRLVTAQPKTASHHSFDLQDYPRFDLLGIFRGNLLHALTVGRSGQQRRSLASHGSWLTQGRHARLVSRLRGE